jgi:hypothetical protein
VQHKRQQGGKHVDIMEKSEVARLRREISLSYQACLRALNSPAITAPHSFITARMEKISDCQEQLVSLVGADAATRITAQAMKETGEENVEVTGKDASKATGEELS